jgi:hypothetical protein
MVTDRLSVYGWMEIRTFRKRIRSANCSTTMFTRIGVSCAATSKFKQHCCTCSCPCWKSYCFCSGMTFYNMLSSGFSSMFMVGILHTLYNFNATLELRIWRIDKTQCESIFLFSAPRCMKRYYFVCRFTGSHLSDKSSIELGIGIEQPFLSWGTCIDIKGSVKVDGKNYNFIFSNL